MRVAFTTLGCKINRTDTEQLQQDLLASGGTIVPFGEQADVYIINTCSVTSRTDYQCRQAIRAAVRRGQGAKVVVTGCYAQTRPDEIRKIPGVDLVMGNSQKERIAGAVLDLLPGPRAGNSGAPADLRPEAVPGSRTRGILKVQDGCSNRCTYCIVPHARGASRSIARKDVEDAFLRLVASGCPEIVLSGIHLGAYGWDLEPRTDLTELLYSLMEKRGSARVRLSSIEPREITEGILDLCEGGLCRHFHIPLQSGDDRVLRSMGRDYTAAFYRDLLRHIAERVPGAALGADVMVGFPGESEAEFLNTLRLIEGSPLTHLHVFPFSQRPGTPAAEMDGQVPEPVKKRRSGILREAGRKKNEAFRRQFLSRTLEVVVEGSFDPSTGLSGGLTDNYLRVLMDSVGSGLTGRKVMAEITGLASDAVLARIIA